MTFPDTMTNEEMKELFKTTYGEEKFRYEYPVVLDCSNLTDEILKGVTFEGTSKAYTIKKLILPDTLALTYGYYGPIDYVSNVEEFVLSENNPNCKVIDGNLYSKDGKTLIKYASGKTETSFAIPSTVKKLAYNAFANSKNLETIKSWGGVVYSSGLEGGTFEKAQKITNLNIPLTWTYLPVEFLRDANIEEIEIPSNITKLDSSSLSTYSLIKITFVGTTPPELDSYALYYGGNPNLKIYVPESAVDAYKAADVFSTYADKIFAIEE